MRLVRYLNGRHTQTEVRWHLAGIVVVYWGLVLCARLGYPSDRHYSITTHFLSALGSYDARHNPHWYWLFNTAMIFCGLALVPVAFYTRRRFQGVSAWGANVGCGLQLVGCTGITCVGLFPDAKGMLLNTWAFHKLHILSCILIILGFGLGSIWHALLLRRDHKTQRNFGIRLLRRFVGPYAVYLFVLFAVMYSLGFERIRLLLTSGVLHMPHVPLLEHVAIWGLTAFLVWFTAVLPWPTPQECETSA